MTTSKPAFARLVIAAGTSATRRSPGKLSLGTPMTMQPPRVALLFYHGAKIGHSGTHDLIYTETVEISRKADCVPEQLYSWLPPEGVKIILVLFLSFLVGLEREEHKAATENY